MKNRCGHSSISVATAAAVLLMLAAHSGIFAGQPEPGIREELLAELTADVRADDWEVIAHRDGGQLAWREKHGNKYLVRLNGTPTGAEYDEVLGLRFSNDGKRLAFAVRKGKEWTVVINGIEHPQTYQKVARPAFSPDSSRFAFTARNKDGWLYVIDGKPGVPYKELTAVEFSPDGRHVAYAGQKGKQWAVVVDEAEGPLYDNAGRPRYAPESGRLVYVARRGKSDLLIDNGKEQPLSDTKDGYVLLGFAPRTEDPILEAFDGDNSRMLIGKLEGPLAHVRLLPIRCDGGCRHSVYATARVHNPAMGLEHAYGRVVVDGKGGREYQGAPPESAGKALLRGVGGSQLRIQQGSVAEFTPRVHGVSTPAVTSDFEHVAYTARRGAKDMTVVVDGVEGPQFEAVPCNPQYSPEGILYYVGVRNGKAALFAGGKNSFEMPLATAEWDEKGVCVGPDFAAGGHYVYGIVQRDGAHFVADGAEFKLRVMLGISGPWTQVVGGRFHFAYAVSPEPGKSEHLLVVDGKESRVYSDIWPDTVKWTGPGVVTYIARQGQKLLKVTQTLP